MKTIILAGGSGSRLWPLSREGYPKQFIKIHDKNESLFQETLRRSVLLSDLTEIFVITNNLYKNLVIGAIDEIGYDSTKINIVIEPESKNTLPAIYLGVNEIIKKGHDSVVVFPSDHVIENNYEFVKIIKESEILTKESIITFGIKPNYPNTGYGYISLGERKHNGFVVKEFKEKPTLEKAIEYVEEGYCWNSGIFMFNSAFLVNEVRSHSLDVHNAFRSSDNISDIFSKLESNISIDYGLLEKSKNVTVVPVDIGWNDLGSFDSFYDVFQEDDDQNISDDKNILIDSKNNLIQSYSDKIIATVGVEDLIIVDNRDALLICKKDQSQKVKNVVDILKNRNDQRVKHSVQDYRPWGHYKVLEEEKNTFKIKRITVNQGKKLSYQLHYHRSEHWIVVKGTAKVIVDSKEYIVRSGESIFFKEGQKHRLENLGKMPLEIIEVQMGNYLEEDDIVRFDDEYGRV